MIPWYCRSTRFRFSSAVGTVCVCSRKAKEIKEFPYAAITFWWGALHRSVRLEGEVVRTSEEESDDYFSCRPTGSKVGCVLVYAALIQYVGFTLYAVANVFLYFYP